MTKPTLQSGVTLLILAVGLAVSQAQTSTSAAKPAAPAASPPAAAPSEFDEFVNQTKKPVDWLTWGADLRLRNEYFNNALSLNQGTANNEQDYFRFRGRVWASVMPMTNLSLNARFSGEPREWMKSPSASGAYGGRSGFEERYGILDNANVKWNNALDTPVSMTAGRQDIAFGDYYDWWLVLDGTPGDGSWTFFLDSIRLGYDAKEIKTKFDAVYIYHNALPDEWIPTLGRSSQNRPPGAPADVPYNLTEQNEQGVILYASNKSVKNTQIDGYFIYKQDDHINEIANGDDADIYTIGAKITGSFAEHWTYSMEGAYQFGTKTDPYWNNPSGLNTTEADIDAIGAKAKLSYLFKDKLNNQPYLFYEFLSGDDPSTEEDEMFDVLWARWPRWSEMYIYSYVNETSRKIAQMNNIHRIGLGWSIDPMKNMNFLVNYSALLADQEVPTRAVGAGAVGGAAPLFSGDGSFRGHYVQAILKHKFNKYVSGHLWSEFVWMGDYYTNKELMSFLRAEVLLTW
jgi:hypothetical protein